ncbi:transcriptional regulator [Bifidobacterium callitrichos]|uniref:Transcriptional regulator n=1 Tax=Bifidobacterium callitrichos TaxID=762209 RepID=A0A2T3GCE5_9BIFI|nr:helix-turn-helix transcriptional regulator [Bifidobacterium callitrichos]PST47071.1 transcriptional regulator [Bifidobacterium callitrichos]
MSLKELRQKRGLTQQQLAGKLGYSRERIAAIETGQRPIGGVSLDKAIEICDALHVANPRKLLEDASPKEGNAE